MCSRNTGKAGGDDTCPGLHAHAEERCTGGTYLPYRTLEGQPWKSCTFCSEVMPSIESSRAFLVYLPRSGCHDKATE